MKTLPSVSFIIPTLNADHLLSRCLQAIRTQEYPQKKIEIIIVDGGSTDKTISIAKKYDVRIISNPDVFQEPGKTLGTQTAKGEMVFYLDSDNVLSNSHWLSSMIEPYITEKNVIGLLPQTIPDTTSHPIDQYFGYLFTDPFTWFVYRNAANPQDYSSVYQSVKKTGMYTLFTFPTNNPPLFGLAQGVGVIKKYGHGSNMSDDMLSGIYALQQGIIAYVPSAGVYHYHITSMNEFIKKYRWRIRNNLTKQYKGVGITIRTQYFPLLRKIRMYLFMAYGLSVIFPFFDSLFLAYKHKSIVMLLHAPLTFIMSCILITEFIEHLFIKNQKLGHYE